jgi:hypothetical protein
MDRVRVRVNAWSPDNIQLISTEMLTPREIRNKHGEGTLADLRLTTNVLLSTL